jgi:DNA-binding CsgD family transcriptional regulator
MLLGRETELATIGRLIDDARAGHGRALAIVGEAGIGKTALWREAASRAPGIQVLAARGLQSESELAFAGLRDLLEPLLDRLGRLPRPQAEALAGALALGPSVRGDAFAVAAATLSLLGLADAPTLAVVDDIHWLDRPSVTAVLFAARRLRDVPVALVILARSDEGSQTDGLDELMLGGLEPDDAHRLLSKSAPGASRAVRDALVQASRGNPLALQELPRALPDEQLSGARPLPDPLPLGGALRRALSRRIEALSDTARAALLIAAASDDGALAPAQTALGPSVPALEEAEGAGVISLAAGRIEFRHPLLRSAVYQASDGAARRSAHAALADALVEDPERRAWHLAAAATGPDEAVAVALEEVARSASARGGAAIAARALSRAAELSTGTSASRRRIEAAQQAVLAGRLDEADALLAAADPDDPVLDADAASLRATILRARGRTREARRLQLSTAQAVQQRDPERAALIAVNAAVSDLMAGDAAASLQAAEYAAAACEIEPVAPIAYATLAFVRYMRGERPPDRSRTAAEWRAVRTPDRRGVGAAAQMALDFLATSWLFHANFRADEVLATVSEMVAEARAAGTLGSLPYLLGNQSMLLYRDGQLRAAALAAAEGAELARDIRHSNFLAWTLVNLARAQAALGDERWRTHAQEAGALAQEFDLGSIAIHVAAIEGLGHLAAGRVAEAVDALERCAGLVDASGLEAPGTVMWQQDHIEALAREGRDEEAETALRNLQRLAARCDSSWGHAAAARGRLLLAPASVLDEAHAAALAFAPNRFDRARTELSYGERLRRAGRRVDARAPLRAALDGFVHLGAAPWAARARAELRATGESAPAESTPAVPMALTPQELTVARLVSDGASNREVAAALFVTEKTVEAHLTRIYRKLGLRRRGQLAQALTVGQWGV